MNFKPLTPDEVKRAYAFARQEAQPGSLLVYLLADLDRLRALVKESEWHAGDREGWCQFCGSLPDGADGMASDDRHSPDCRAFTPDGVVK